MGEEANGQYFVRAGATGEGHWGFRFVSSKGQLHTHTHTHTVHSGDLDHFTKDVEPAEAES